MKKIILTIIVFSIYGNLFSSELKFTPNKVKISDTVSVVFSNNPRFDSRENIDLLYYAFTNEDNSPRGYETILSKKGNSWQGNFVVPNDAVYIIFKIFSQGEYIDIIDNNYGNYWDLLVHNNNGVPVKNAYLKSALLRLGSVSSNIDRIPNYYEAYELLEKELKTYPNNIVAEMGLATTLFDMKKINEKEFNDRLNQISVSKIDENNEAEVKTLSRCLSAINQNEKSKSVEEKFVRLNPNSNLAEEYLISTISNAENFKSFADYCLEFFNRFPNSISKDRIYTAFATAYLQSNKIKELILILDSLPKTPAYIYARVAKSLFYSYKLQEQTITPTNKELLLALIDKAQSRILKDKDLIEISKPSIYTLGEWIDILDIETATIMEIKAEILKEFEPANSISAFQDAIALFRNYANENIYENYIETLLALGDSSKALQSSEDALKKGKSSELIFQYHSELSRKLNTTNDSLYDLKLAEIELERNSLYNEIYENELLNINDVQFALQTLEGTLVDNRDLQDKIVVMNFFSSWCEPCKAMFPALETLFETLALNDGIEFVSVNVWENANTRLEDLKKFTYDNQIEFPVAQDMLDVITRQSGIIGLPTIAILGENSTIRFLVRGFSNNENLINDVLGRVDFLMRMENH